MTAARGRESESVCLHHTARGHATPHETFTIVETEGNVRAKCLQFGPLALFCTLEYLQNHQLSTFLFSSTGVQTCLHLYRSKQTHQCKHRSAYTFASLMTYAVSDCALANLSAGVKILLHDYTSDPTQEPPYTMFHKTFWQQKRFNTSPDRMFNTNREQTAII